MVSTNLKRKNFPHVPRIGEEFQYEGQRYKITSIPNFSLVIGENINPGGEPFKVEIKPNQCEW